jgi:hypothetical protein
MTLAEAIETTRIRRVEGLTGGRTAVIPIQPFRGSLCDSMHGNQCRLSCGWSSKNGTAPQEVVFSFHQGRIALVTAVTIHTATEETIRNPDKGAKHVEIWASTTSPTDGFGRVAGARLHWRAVEQAITFPPTPAKYVKVRFLSNHGGSGIQAGEAVGRPLPHPL